jgi:ATP-dependent exoDNAse (exonuclease V) alpha subunit
VAQESQPRGTTGVLSRPVVTTILQRAITINIREFPHLDYGYAVTSHGSHGQTADRVLIHVDTEQGGEKLVNRRLAYVAVSRGRYDAQIYTNDKTALAEGLGRDCFTSTSIGVDPRSRATGRIKKRAALFTDSGERANHRTRF